MPMLPREQIEDALRAVIDPELRKDIVVARHGALDRAARAGTRRRRRVADHARLPDPLPLREGRRGERRARSTACSTVNVGFDVLSPDEKQGLQQRLGRQGGLPEGALAAVKNVICVGSGKGGVGKSTVTANLAAALQPRASTPPRSTPTSGATRSRACSACTAARWSRPSARSSRSRPPAASRRSRSSSSSTSSDQAITWRGPMLHKAIRQFLEDVDWGELDYLLIDLPPGTGDVSMTLAQLLPQAKFVIVTTPQPAAQKVAAARRRDGAKRFDLEIAGRDREHVRLHHARRRALHDLRRGRRPAARRRARRAAARQDPAPGGAARWAPTRAARSSLEDPDAPASQAIHHAARGLIAATPQELPVLQAALGRRARSGTAADAPARRCRMAP